MRFMVLLKATADSEAGVLPDTALMTAMIKFNQEMVDAGVLLAADGLQATSKGARIRFSGADRTVIDGPFPNDGQLLAGFWMLQVESRQEAIDWIKRCPNPMPGESEIEIRQVFEAADFGETFTPELQEQVGRMHAKVAAQP